MANRMTNRTASARASDADLPGARGHVREGDVLIWGLHAAREAWLNPKRRVMRAWLTEAGAAAFEVTMTEAREALLKRPDAKRTERQGLDRLTPPGSVHQGILLEVAPLHEPSLHDVISVRSAAGFDPAARSGQRSA